MAGRRGRGPGGCPGSGHGMRDQAEAVLAEVGVPPGQHDAYLSFALGLERMQRHEPAPGYGPMVRALVRRWFERGLSGHLLWLIGERVAGVSTKS
jgi:hypothetical protein